MAPSRKNPLASRKRLVKHWLPGVLAVAGTSVLAFRKPISLGDHSFQDVRMDCSKGRKPVASEEYKQGPPACRDGLDPVRDCRRPRRNVKFLQRLNLLPAQTGENRIFAVRRTFAADSGVGSNLDTPNLCWFWPATVREGRLFICRPARRVRQTEGLRVRFWAGRWV
jgi:hypothetical protein